FAARHKVLKLEPVELTPRELPPALRRGDVDLALVGVSDPALRREFNVRVVSTYAVLLALGAAHPLAKRRKLKLSELRDAEWITWDEREFPGRKQGLVHACRAAGFRPRIVFQTDSMASLFVQVATSQAIGHVVPQTRRMPHDGVVFAEIDPPESFMSEMNVAWRRADPRARLIEELVAEMGAMRA
ncbi:MAG TPA: LysR family substrate-binding domain-containing protein, partial [Acidobacteriota bacterium]|nr:LysR family substrate-binding domain-containing protein [Acidobacteriota bacterium]